MSTNIPLTGEFYVSNPYRVKNSRYKAGFHTGIDLVPIGTKYIYSPCIGIVHKYGYDNSYGNYIVIKDSENRYHWLCHLHSILVKKNQNVLRETIVGIVGNTGNSTGIHLHYEIRNSKNLYGQVLDVAKYMGIPNTIGSYNTKNFTIETEKNSILVKFTGIWDRDIYYVEYKNQNFWIKKEDIISSEKDKIIMSTKKFIKTGSVEGDKIMVEYEKQQFWL